jgi:hypothetical protein
LLRCAPKIGEEKKTMKKKQRRYYTAVAAASAVKTAVRAIKGHEKRH